MRSRLRTFVRQWIPRSLRRLPDRASVWPPLGTLRFGSFRRTDPVSRDWGFDRGTPIDRYYIEQFLHANQDAIRGRVLEIDNDAYTSAFGGDRVIRSDVLHIAEENPGVTIVGNLTDAGHIPSDAFDCVILTQTLQFIYDFRAALDTVHRILRPGGVLLATVPGISKVSGDENGRWAHCWSFTAVSVERLFGEYFPRDHITVGVKGNVLSAMAFLHGLAAAELRRDELDLADPEYEVLIGIRATKPPTSP